MSSNNKIKRLLKLGPSISIADVYFEDEEEDAVEGEGEDEEESEGEEEQGEEICIVRVRPLAREALCCPHCGKQGKVYDSSNKYRRWRALDASGTKVYIEAAVPRISCPEHGVVVARVPWARHASDYTYDFEQAVTWMTVRNTIKDVAEYHRIGWHTVESIARRVQKALEATKPNRFDNLEEIGIDETSYKKGHKYMTVVVNHKTGQLIWAKKDHGKEVLAEFFKALTEEQRAKIKYVTADGARWIAEIVKQYCPNAQRCIDPFHVVSWANNSLDTVRKETIKQATQEAAKGKKASLSKKKRIIR